jgi:hypothetical protein
MVEKNHGWELPLKEGHKYVKKHWLPGCPACNKSRAKLSGQGMYIGNFLIL